MDLSTHEPSFLILSGVQGDTRRYRTFHLHQQLRLLGAASTLSHLTDPALPGQLERADVIVLHRVAQDGYVARLLERARRRGALLILDADDLVFDVDAFEWIDSPDFQDPVRRRLYREEMLRQRATLEACDAALAATPYLAAQIERLGLRARVHRNAFSFEMLAAAEVALASGAPRDEGIAIGFASGTLTHNRDFAAITPALQAVLARHPAARLEIIGRLELDETWRGYAGRIRRRGFLPWRELPRALAGFDVNLAPLVIDNPFSQSKSEIKFVEAGLVRVATVASAAPAFREAITDREDGYLAATAEEWQAALEGLLAAPELRREAGARAYRTVLRDYHPAARAAQLAETLDAIGLATRGTRLAPAGERPAADGDIRHAYWIPPEVEAHPNLLDRARYSLRHRGAGTLAGQVWIFVRRLLAPLFPFKR